MSASKGEGVSAEGEASWNESERLILVPAIGLIKTARVALKKVTSAIKTNVYFEATSSLDSSYESLACSLDKIEVSVQPLSAIVDDFALTLYPEIDRDDVIMQVCLFSFLFVEKESFY